MSGYAVCILAAGLGTRSTAFGGRLHKALLPVGPLPVLSRIIDQFPADSRFIIAVGHRADQIADYLALAHPGLDVTLVPVDRVAGPGAGPGYSLWCCRDHLHSPFILTSCDTLVADPVPSPLHNWMGVQPVEEGRHWCCVETGPGGAVVGLRYKNLAGPALAFIGLAAVRDAEVFWQGLAGSLATSGEAQVNAGFQALTVAGLAAVTMRWHDTGSDETYRQTVAAYGGSLTFDGKSTDLTYRVGDQIVKFFPDPAVCERRYQRGLDNADCFAPVTGRQGAFLGCRFIEGRVLAGHMDGPLTTRLLAWLEARLWQPVVADGVDFAALCRAFYRDKTLERLDAFLAAFMPDGEPEQMVLNGRRCPTARAMVEGIAEPVWGNGCPSRFHGDLHDGNIIETDNGFALIDWRQDFAGALHIGDRYYDLAKLLHTLDLSIDTMAAGDYAITPAPGSLSSTDLHLTHAVTPALAIAEDAFWAFAATAGYDRQRIALLNGLIFINMAPLYERPMAFYLYHLGRLRLCQALDA